MIDRLVPVRVSEHMSVFNEAVRSGEFGNLAARFTADAVMSFADVPVGPFRGRDAIRSGYEAAPPDDTMEVTGVDSKGDTDTVRFRWSKGDTGSMTLRWEGDLVAEIEISFDEEAL